MRFKPSVLLNGFTLVEVTLALGVASFAILSVVGLLSVGMNLNQNTVNRSTAANIATAISSDIRSSLALKTGTTSVFGLSIPTTSGSVAIETNSRYFDINGRPSKDCQTLALEAYRATVLFSSSNSSARILITWPAVADSDPTKMPTRFSNSLDTLTFVTRD